MGIGYSSMSVSQSRVFTMGNVDDTDAVSCFDADSGKQLWKHEYPVKYTVSYPAGPRCTPAVSDGKVSASLPAFTITVDQPATRSVTLTWQAPTLNEDGSPLTDLAGYEVRYGQSPGQYSQTLPLPNAALTSVTVEDLAPATWYFAVKAVNSAGVQSSFSNEAWKTIN